MVQRGRALLLEAEERAKQHAAEYGAEREEEALALRDEASRELTSVRDEYDDLARTAPEGRAAAVDLEEQLNALQVRQMEAEARLDRVQEIKGRGRPGGVLG